MNQTILNEHDQLRKIFGDEYIHTIYSPRSMGLNNDSIYIYLNINVIGSDQFKELEQLGYKILLVEKIERKKGLVIKVGKNYE
jgi:hypothetical protein